MATQIIIAPPGSSVMVMHDNVHHKSGPGKWLAPFWDMSAQPGGTQAFACMCTAVFRVPVVDIAARVGRVYALE